MKLPRGVTTRIILVRHGEPVETAKGRCYGKLDVGLSENGKNQIEQTANWLSNFEPAAVYSSPRSRAAESAKIVAEKCNLFVEPNENFAEINFGDFEGQTYETVERKFPEIYHQWMTAPTLVQFPNGESFAQMQQRVLVAIETLKNQHRNETFCLVAHGGVNRIVLGASLNLSNADIFRLEQSYAAANVIDFYDDFPVVRIMNWTAEILWR